MKIYKIKLEDKAAFLNRLEKANIPLSTSQIKDNTLEGYFTVSTSNLKQQQVIKYVLSQSPAIDTVKENFLQQLIRKEIKISIKEYSNKLSKSSLKTLIQEEIEDLTKKKQAK